MKLFRLISVALLATSLFVASASQNEVKAQPGVHISFQNFYNDLAPYGRWMNNAQYGTVWLPNVGPDFHPYMSNGNWVMTEYGNTWVSDFAWGWGPFHYGRWFLDDYYGWAWVPGYEWAPAWVSWRNGGGYYGWAPLGPGMNIGINISIHIPSPWWIFIPQRYYMSNRWHNYRVPARNVVNIYNQTTIINNYYNQDNRVYSYGPRREEITQVTRRNVDVYRPEYVGRERYVSSRNGEFVDNSSRQRSSFMADNGRSNGESGRVISEPSNGRSTGVTESPRTGNRAPAYGNSSDEVITNGRTSDYSNGRSTGRTYSNEGSAPSSAPNNRSYEAPSSGSTRSRSVESSPNGRTYETPNSRSSSGRSTGSTFEQSRSRNESYSPRSSSPSNSRSSTPSASPRESSRSTGERSSRGN